MTWKNYTIKLVIFFLVVIQVGCATRKTERIKEIEKIKSVEELSFTDFSRFKQFDINESFDRGFSYVIERSNTGDVKETFVQNNKSDVKIKYVDLVRYINTKEYKKYDIVKTITIKETQKEAISIWVWVVGFLFASVVGLVVYYYPKI